MTTNETKTETAARTRIDARQTKMYGTTLAHLRDDVAQIKADTFAPGGASDAVRGAYEALDDPESTPGPGGVSFEDMQYRLDIAYRAFADED